MEKDLLFQGFNGESFLMFHLVTSMSTTITIAVSHLTAALNIINT
jgi:hypothetical protein